MIRALQAIQDRDFLKWLTPGLHIKRWLLLLMVGVAIMGLGIAYILREVYVSYTFPSGVYYLTLQFMPRIARGVLFMGAAVGLILFSTWKLNLSLLSAFMPARGREESLVNIIYNHRAAQRGPKIVAIGGGTGLSTLLRGLKQYTANLSAIVTVADDGGSSGKLRREMGVLAPGDLRQCIAALAEAEPLMTELFQYRFSEGSGLEGHSFGNLFIVAMAEVTGNFETALKETSRVLAVRGEIMPSTLSHVTLCATTEDHSMVYGESSITASGRRISELRLNPPHVRGYLGAIRAILEADLVVVGPGSLYTSVLPNLLVEDIRKALEITRARKLYVCNVATQHGETDGFSVRDHLAVIDRHVGPGLFDAVLANSNLSAPIPSSAGAAPVNGKARGEGPTAIGRARVLYADVVDHENGYRHDPAKLAEAIMSFYLDRRPVVHREVERPEAIAASV
ncbi:MAG TPA: gluconeogenesis factor YvcK family protein [Dehalococcoidia bacterium]|nr:gluconeogenesis factor YvcK family protein [Dehalococcoidia bacterium]